jgi:hypothetical protein
MRTRHIGRSATTLGAVLLLTAGLGTTGAQATAGQARMAGDSYELVVNQVAETQDWCNGAGCAEHQSTVAKLYIKYTYVEDADGNLISKPIRAHIAGSTRTWTDLLLAGFHATSQVTLGPVYVQTPQYRYGVDGVWIGQHDRTDQWDTEVALSSALADRSSKGGTMDVNFWRG